MSLLPKKHLGWGIVFALCSLLATAVLQQRGWLDLLEWMSFDWRMRLFNAEKSAPPQIAVILIDEASLQYLNEEAGRWPWPRSVHADLVDFLALGHPRAVVFDILFVENQKQCAADAGGDLHDRRLAEATAQSNFTYHAMQLREEHQDEYPMARLHVPLPAEFIARYALNPPQPVLNKPRLNALPADSGYNEYQLPIEGLWQGARGVGVVRAEADRDGRFRRIQLFHRYQNYIYPSLATAPALDVLHPAHISFDAGAVNLDRVRVPLDSQGQYLINTYGKFRAYSYSGLIASLRKLKAGDVEDLLIHPGEFENSIVFIGSDAVGVQDLKSTPLSNKTAGVYLQASVAGNLLEQDFLQPASWKVTSTSAALLALLAAFGALIARHLRIKLLALLVLGAAYTFACIVAFRSNFVLELAAPLLCTALSWFAAFSYMFFTEGKDKRRVRTVLAQYVSPAVLAEVVDKYEEYLKAEVGRKEIISLVFSDIRGFTTLSETLPAEKVVEILNVYFSAMTEVIFAQHGTIDKFIGDAIMAFWGAPIRTQDHAQRAVQTAIRMLQTLPEVNAKIGALGYPPLDIGVGVHTGEVILGNIGSDKKLEYTAIGDNVNLASRLEGLTKPYDCPLLISETTYEQVKNFVPCRIVDRVRVKGRSVPIHVYAPVYPAQSNEVANPAWHRQARELCTQTEKAFNLYLQRAWRPAIALYETLPQDAIRTLYLQRCNDFLAQEPRADWDGVFTMQSK